MDKQIVLDPHKGILFSNKKEWTARPCNVGDSEQKKPDTVST